MINLLTEEELEALLVLLDLTDVNKLKNDLGFNYVRVLKNLQKKMIKQELNG